MTHRAAERIGAVLLLALVIPRIARMLYPQLWVEDDFYLESAYRVAHGGRPYLDFVHPHMPVLEWLAGAYVSTVGAGIARLELLNQAAIYAASVLTYSLALRVANRQVAIAASVLLAFSSLVFRFHCYERECFLMPLALVGALVVLDRDMPASRQVAALAAILLLGCAIKLTAIIWGTLLLGFVVVADRRWSRALVAGVVFLAGFVLLSAVCFRLYGSNFLYQTFVFQFMKGYVAGATATYPARILDVLVPLFALGVVRIAAGRPINRALALTLAVVVAEYAFFGLLSPTQWAHNYLEALPFIAIVAGVGASRLIDAMRSARADWPCLAGGAAAIAVSLLWLAPLENQNWMRGSVYGFGFVGRDEVAALGSALRKASRDDEEVIAPSFLCFEAGRRQLIGFPETYGKWRQAELEIQRDGLRAALAHLGRADFYRVIAETSHFWRDEMDAAIRSGRVNAVINDARIQVQPLVNIRDGFLTAMGFAPTLRTTHYTLWVRTPGVSSGPSIRPGPAASTS